MRWTGGSRVLADDENEERAEGTPGAFILILIIGVCQKLLTFSQP